MTRDEGSWCDGGFINQNIDEAKLENPNDQIRKKKFPDGKIF
jgi:hypothetical protein